MIISKVKVHRTNSSCIYFSIPGYILSMSFHYDGNFICGKGKFVVENNTYDIPGGY